MKKMSKIVAIVTRDVDKVGGGAPIFITKDEDEQQLTALILEKILDANVHDLKNGTMVIVKHA